MYKILIVEDEARMRRALITTIKWGEFGFEVAGEAADGQEGLDEYRRLLPDVVLTDVRMPVMDGIELIKKIIEDDKNVKTIILSGYSEFQYAVKAIEYGVSSYLLKPLEDEKLASIMNQLKSELDEERQRFMEEEKLNKYIVDNSRIVMEKLLNDLIKGTYHNVLKFGNQIGDHTMDNDYIFLVISIDNFIKVTLNNNEERKQGLKQNIFSVVEECTHMENGTVFNSAEDEISVVLPVNTKYYMKAKEYAVSASELIQRRTAKEISSNDDISLTFGISNVWSGTDNLKKAYKEAAKAVSNRLILGKGKIILYSQVYTKENAGRTENFSKGKELLNNLYAGDKEPLFAIVDNELGRFKPGMDVTIEDVHKICVEMAVIIEKFIEEQGIRMEEIFGDNINWLKEIRLYQTIEDMAQWLKKTLLKITCAVSLLKNNDKYKIIEKVKEYINDNILGDVSLANAAARVYLSPNYLSNIFKQVTGQNFSDYLIYSKIDKAKALLKNPKYKICFIAQKLGYNDIQYFTKLFKKLAGVTPASFRDIYMKTL